MFIGWHMLASIYHSPTVIRKKMGMLLVVSPGTSSTIISPEGRQWVYPGGRTKRGTGGPKNADRACNKNQPKMDLHIGKKPPPSAFLVASFFLADPMKSQVGMGYTNHVWHLWSSWTRLIIELTTFHRFGDENLKLQRGAPAG